MVSNNVNGDLLFVLVITSIACNLDALEDNLACALYRVGEVVGLVIFGNACIDELAICSTTGDIGGINTCNMNLLAIVALAVAVEVQHAAGQEFARTGQGFSDLYISSQIAFAISIAIVEQLACQGVQNLVNLFLIVNVDVVGLVGNHGNAGACCCTVDNQVASSVILSIRAVIQMTKEDLGVATVLVKYHVFFVILEEVTSSFSSCATGEVGYFVSSDAQSFFAVIVAIVPNSAILQGYSSAGSVVVVQIALPAGGCSIQNDDRARASNCFFGSSALQHFITFKDNFLTAFRIQSNGAAFSINCITIDGSVIQAAAFSGDESIVHNCYHAGSLISALSGNSVTFLGQLNLHLVSYSYLVACCYQRIGNNYRLCRSFRIYSTFFSAAVLFSQHDAILQRSNHGSVSCVISTATFYKGDIAGCSDATACQAFSDAQFTSQTAISIKY